MGLILVDSYSETNYVTGVTLVSGGIVKAGQSFTGNSINLDSCKFYLSKSGSPTGNAVAKIYAHTGTFGTSSIPTGAALATSGNFDVSTLSTSPQLITFTFTGANTIPLTNGTKYCIVLEYSDGANDNYIQMGYDSSTATHDGNMMYYATSWSYGVVDRDFCFYVYSSTITVTAITAITGTPRVGVTLTAGAITPAGATVTYQWQRADTSGGAYSNIGGATSSTYKLVTADITKFIKVVATGTGDYSGSVTSAATTVVVAVVGYRIANPIDLDSIKNAGSSDISWSETKPANTNINVYTKISTDPLNTPLTWDVATNGSSIIGMTIIDDLTGKYLWVKEELISIDSIAIPKISSLSINIAESVGLLVTVIENQVVQTRYIPFPDDRDKWMDTDHILDLEGAAGDYCFNFTPDAQMIQRIDAIDIGVQPVSFQLIAKYKLVNAQEIWDSNVLGTIQLQINYTDLTNDYFIIPCIKGATQKDRSLTNFWILVTNVCPVDATKTLNYIKIVAKTTNCVNILNIDYIELRKEV